MTLSASARRIVDIQLASASQNDPGLAAAVERRQLKETLQQLADRDDAIAAMVKDVQDWLNAYEATWESFITAWNAFAVSGGNGTTTDISPLTISVVANDHKYTDDGTTEGTAFPAIA